MPILTYGINHKTAPLDIRERFAFDHTHTADALRDLTRLPAINEAVILSTCNRTEIYSPVKDVGVLDEWLKSQRNVKDLNFTDFRYHYSGIDAVCHIMRVASGLDSMVLGEPQILGQMKQAYHLAIEAGAVGQHLKQLFPAVFATTKQIRSETAIGTQPVSVAYAAVQLAKHIFASLESRTALLIGAGETIELVANYLATHGIKQLIFANRTVEKAQVLADQFHGLAVRISEVPQHLRQADLVFSATASQLPIIGKGMIENLLRETKRRALFMVDLAVPRDIEPQVAELEDVYLYNVDDLKNVVQQNLKNRHEAAKQAESIIEMQAQHYLQQLRVLNASDMIRHYRAQITEMRDIELARALAQIDNGQDPKDVLGLLAHNLSNKIMHQPTVKLRQAAYDDDVDALLLAKELFEL